MHKVLLVLAFVLLAVVGLLLLVLLCSFCAHRICLRREAKKITDYGRRLKVFDGEINVLETGSGTETLVLLPGYGTSSPGLDFTPLLRELQNDFRVVVIEPFGYGLSSQTARERTLGNIVEELHEAVSQLGLSRYILGGHSIAGIYSLHYIQAYPDEVKAFVGIDTSVPKQPFPGFSDGLITFLQRAGIIRLAIRLSPDRFAVDYGDPEISRQFGYLQMKNMSNPTMRREGQHLTSFFAASRDMLFPRDLPVLLFVAPDSSTAVPNWHAMHEELLQNCTRAKLVELPGSHYLHHTASHEIAEEIKTAFLETGKA